MNIPPSEADRLSYYEYHELVYHWNDDGEDVPDIDRTMKLIDVAKADPRLTKSRREPTDA